MTQFHTVTDLRDDIDRARVKFFHLAAGLRATLVQPLPPARVAAALGAACARWRDHTFAPRRETVAAIAAAWGWSEPLLDQSLDALLVPFSAQALDGFARRAPQQRDLVGLIMPGNIPAAGIHEIAIGLIAGCALMVKTATAEPIFFAQFAQTLRDADAEVGARIAVLNWGRERTELTTAFCNNCHWIAAFGADETIAQIEASARAAARVPPVVSNAQLVSREMGTGGLAVGFGSRASGVLVAAETAAGAHATAVADAIACDVSLFEQQGCLSPHHIFVQAREIGAACEFARELAVALERCATRMPPPRRHGLEEAAAVRRVRESARWRAIGGDAVTLWEGAGFGWTVICDAAAVFTRSPGYRTVTVSPFADLEDLKSRLRPVAGGIEAFAIAAPSDQREVLRAALADLGVCWLCEPGAMQSPPIDWSHGGGAFLRALASSR